VTVPLVALMLGDDRDGTLREPQHPEGGVCVVGLQSHRTAAAISSARPSRPIGWFCTASGTSSSPWSIMAWTIGVWIVPGQTALMRMPRGGVLQGGAAGEADHAVLAAW
jgi:hypothetical protein